MLTLQDRLNEVFPQPQPRGLQSEIALLCKVKPASVSAWFKLPDKVSSISRSNAETLCSHFNLKVSPAWLAEGVSPKHSVAISNVSPGPNIRGSVPLLSSVQAGAFKEILDRYSGEDGMMDQIPTTVPVNRYTFALRVQGDSMEPKFTEGMLLIVEPELDAQNNDYVIVKNGSEETTFKRLVRDGEDWFLKPLNDRYPIKPLGKNTIVGVVRGVTEQFR